MSNKDYQTPKKAPETAAEPAVTYYKTTAETTSPDSWNPNVPFTGTQEEWRDHFLRIEEGDFTPLEVANKEFEAWKKDYLANRLK
ncbi:MAG: hypothetical protein LBR08_07895 [Bacteroidales bacterium]|jgi:hypothetical protein|nr:hypothetical protein [Bacteroidales bacterium]